MLAVAWIGTRIVTKRRLRKKLVVGTAALFLAFLGVYNIVLKASLTFLDDGVFWKDALLGYDVEKKYFTLEATLAAGTKRTYQGTLKEKDQELTLTQTGEEFPKERVIFSLLRSNRFLITYELQAAKGKDWAAQAVLGVTKEGVPFATGTGPVCIVTGGTGSMTVSYQGKSYYVCCSGCRTSFNDNPGKTIAEAKKQGWIKE